MENFLTPLKSAWKIPDLKKKILASFLLLLVYRVGVYIPVPGLSDVALRELAQGQGGLFGFLNIIGGGAFERASIFAMSITPYINASIIMQLLTIAIPALERLQKEGEEGRKKLAQWVRYGTVILGFLQATFTYIGFRGAIAKPSTISFLTITFALTAGTAFIMWLGEQINEYGIGNGISLIIFVNIISRVPTGQRAIRHCKAYALDGRPAISILVVAAIYWLFWPCHVRNWVTGREGYLSVRQAGGWQEVWGQSTHIPVKVNVAGVIPIIFAMSILAFFPTIIGLVAPNTTSKFLLALIEFNRSPVYMLVYGLLILFFTFFYTIMVFNPVELANNIRKNGGFIPGIRPGKPTSDYITKVLNRITWFGAFFLALIAILPIALGFITNIHNMWFGGTSVLIMVGVALETMKQIESQLIMRHYKGFLD